MKSKGMVTLIERLIVINPLALKLRAIPFNCVGSMHKDFSIFYTYIKHEVNSYCKRNHSIQYTQLNLSQKELKYMPDI